jgi:hypothetical protein
LTYQIDWEEPFTLDQINLLKDVSKDYGIYQIYGKHLDYGKDILLYIGKADQQTIGQRVSQENWWDTNDSRHLKIYVGRLAGERTPQDKGWSQEMDLAEKLLINVHKPAYNSKNLSTFPDIELQDVHILNWGDYRDLLPEVSGLRWSKKLDNYIYEIYSYNN